MYFLILKKDMIKIQRGTKKDKSTMHIMRWEKINRRLKEILGL